MNRQTTAILHILIRGLPENADKVTDEWVVRTYITDINTEINADIDRSHRLGRSRKKQKIKHSL